VIDVGDYFFNGNTVWLDHGQRPAHHVLPPEQPPTCSVAMCCKPAEHLLQAVGATGRVTGPHLHWGVMLNRTMVDPALFLAAQ
jgi:hypothetical protein